MKNPWSYPESIRFLEDQIALRRSLGPATISTAPVRRLLSELGNPERSFPAVYVCGTSGKGSVATMIAAIMNAASYKTGLVLSPHVRDYTERIQIGGREISRKDFVSTVFDVRGALERIQAKNKRFHASIFEILVATQFLFFANKRADLAVVETGIGGPKDATTTCRAILDVLTSVSLEHERFLGRTLAKIADTERKAFHRGALQVIGALPSRARVVVEKSFSRQPLVLGDSIKISSCAVTETGTVCNVSVRSKDFDRLRTRLVGFFQCNNMALAVAAATQLERKGFDVPERAIRTGLWNARIRDRFELRKIGRRVWILDGAHNPEKIRAMVRTYRHLFGDQRAAVILAVKQDKNLTPMLKSLMTIAKRFVVTEFSAEKSYPCELLAKRLQQLGFNGVVESDPDPQKALEHVGRGSLMLVTGSLYLYNRIEQYVS